MKFTFGSDPELFFSKDNIIRSAIGTLPHQDFKIEDEDGYSFYHDNVLAEFTVPPASTRAEAVKIMGEGLQRLLNLAGDYSLAPEPAAWMTAEDMENKYAKIINCNPEACAYLQTMMKVDEIAFQNSNLRTSGGHIHLGAPILLKDYNSYIAVYLLDLFLGVPSVLLDRNPLSKVRKVWYGKAGRYRTKEYGIEYRTLGNFWIQSPAVLELVYDICDFTLEFLKKGKWKKLWTIDTERLNSYEAWSDVNFRTYQCYDCIGYDANEVRRIIDEADVEAAEKMMSYISTLMPVELVDRINLAAAACEKAELNVYRDWDLYTCKAGAC